MSASLFIGVSGLDIMFRSASNSIVLRGLLTYYTSGTGPVQSTFSTSVCYCYHFNAENDSRREIQMLNFCSKLPMMYSYVAPRAT